MQPERFDDPGLPVRDILQRRAAPQREGARVDVDCAIVLPAQLVAASGRHQSLEAHGVDRVGVHREPVLPPDRLDRLPTES